MRDALLRTTPVIANGAMVEFHDADVVDINDDDTDDESADAVSRGRLGLR